MQIRPMPPSDVEREAPRTSIEWGASGFLRPGRWRWLRAILWMLCMLAVISGILSLQSLVASVCPLPQIVLTMAFVCTVLAYLAYAVLVRWGERRQPVELALRPVFRETLVGFLIGFLLMGLVFVLLIGTGAYHIAPGNWTDWAHDIRETLGTGLLEELLARLVIFRLLGRAFGMSWALALSSAAFGAAHLGNENANLIAAAAIAVEAGLLLAGFYVLTGRIWMSVGIHASWNFTQGALFGANVSGLPSRGSLFVATPAPDMPDFVSGGAFGPEASLPAIVVGLSAFCVTVYLANRSTCAPAGV